MGKRRSVHPVAQLEDDNDFAREAKLLEATGAFSLKELRTQRRLHKNRLAARRTIAQRALKSACLQEENRFLQVSHLVHLHLHCLCFLPLFSSSALPQAQCTIAEARKNELKSESVDRMIRIFHLERKKDKIQQAMEKMLMLKANPSAKLSDLPSAVVHPKLGDIVDDDPQNVDEVDDPLDNLDIQDVGF